MHRGWAPAATLAWLVGTTAPSAHADGAARPSPGARCPADDGPCKVAVGGMKVVEQPAPAAEPPVALSVGLGFGLALAPMMVAGGLAATTGDVRTRRRSLEVLAGGLALAPIVSHLVAGEGARAAVFGGVTVSAAVLSTVLLESVPKILDDTKHPACVVLGGALAALLVTSGYGLVDSLMAGERAKGRARLELAPAVGPGTLALGVRGRL